MLHKQILISFSTIYFMLLHLSDITITNHNYINSIDIVTFLHLKTSHRTRIIPVGFHFPLIHYMYRENREQTNGDHNSSPLGQAQQS